IAVTQRGGKEVEIGVSRYITNPDGESCEFAVVIADQWQGRGIAGRLMSELIAVAREKRLKQMMGHVLASNSRMLKFVGELGFTLSHDPSDPTVKRAVLALQPR
ncbi:MAG: GNAT family N-acetyltransferase, partial [Betaproteobacteria bacterium]|nr:GNAT family N-acetyltransferase [Betaproteobacteria bacterium]